MSVHLFFGTSETSWMILDVPDSPGYLSMYLPSQDNMGILVGTIPSAQVQAIHENLINMGVSHDITVF